MATHDSNCMCLECATSRAKLEQFNTNYTTFAHPQVCMCDECITPPDTCACSPTETCPICKDDKLAAGISPKFDQGKLQYSLIPTLATKALASVLTYGAQKYAANSWQNVDNGLTRYLDAAIRHLEDYRAGEYLDRESKLPHLAHLLTNISFLTHLEETRVLTSAEHDNRNPNTGTACETSPTNYELIREFGANVEQSLLDAGITKTPTGYKGVNVCNSK